MNTKRKNIFVAALSSILAVVLAVGGGTLAYLQSESENVVNEFNTFRVNVSLAETTGSAYNIVPGTEQAKDPTVSVDNTTDAYVYVKVTDSTEGLIGYSIADSWQELEGYDGVYYMYVAADAADKSFAVLKDNKVVYGADIGNSAMLDSEGNLKEGIELTFKAYAIQADAFGSAAEAYPYASAVKVGTAEALTSVLESGGSAALTDNVVIDDFIEIPEGAEVVLDLAGKTITTQNNPDTELGQDAQARPIVNYGSLTIIGDGTIDTTGTQAFGTIRNYGTLVIESGTFIGYDLGNGASIDNQTGGHAVINGGTYYATGAVNNRAGATMEINGGDFEGVSNANPMYGSGVYSYAVQNSGEMTINDGYVHGSMNGGVACNSGTITINGGSFTVEDPEGSPTSYYVLVTNPSAGAKIIVNGGRFEQNNGTDRLIGGYTGMPSWDAAEDLEANGYTVNGGEFILNGETVTVGG